MSSYSIFAQFYDELTANVEYRSISQLIDILIHKYAANGSGVLLDMACGTGNFSQCMEFLGYDVLAVDSSEEMLMAAMEKKISNGLNIQYILQDIRKLELYGSADIFLCMLDSINHFTDESDVNAVFASIRKYANPNALLIFDINTIYKHRYILDGNVFLYETPDVYCVWSNTLRENDIIDINLDFFVPNQDGDYTRHSEYFSERAFELSLIESLLSDNGFKILDKFDGFSLNPPHSESERILIAAKFTGD